MLGILCWIEHLVRIEFIILFISNGQPDLLPHLVPQQVDHLNTDDNLKKGFK